MRPWFLIAATCLYASLATLGVVGDEVSPATRKAEKTGRQSATIPVTADKGRVLRDVAVGRDGHVYSLLAVRELDSPDAAVDSGAALVRVLDRDGQLIHEWEVDFGAQAINIGPDGTIYLGGHGRLVSCDRQGALINRGESPQISILADEDALRERAGEQIEAAKESQAEKVESRRQEHKALEARYAQLLKQQETASENPADRNARALKSQLFRLKSEIRQSDQRLMSAKMYHIPTLDEAVKSIKSRISTVNAIAADDQDVFVACSMGKGFGYAIWRTDREFKSPKQIVSGLSGCCGQMDIQTIEGEVFVAENSRHRVVRYDREGKKLGSFGKTDREGVSEGFSGCCNPMNLCFTADGALLTSESNGIVKRFTRDGKFESMVGNANVKPGCKNSAIGISSDGDHLYYIDIENSNIIMLTRGDGVAGSTN